MEMSKQNLIEESKTIEQSKTIAPVNYNEEEFLEACETGKDLNIYIGDNYKYYHHLFDQVKKVIKNDEILLQLHSTHIKYQKVIQENKQKLLDLLKKKNNYNHAEELINAAKNDNEIVFQYLYRQEWFHYSSKYVDAYNIAFANNSKHVIRAMIQSCFINSDDSKLFSEINFETFLFLQDKFKESHYLWIFAMTKDKKIMNYIVKNYDSVKYFLTSYNTKDYVSYFLNSYFDKLEILFLKDKKFIMHNHVFEYNYNKTITKRDSYFRINEFTDDQKEKLVINLLNSHPDFRQNIIKYWKDNGVDDFIITALDKTKPKV